MQLIVCVFCNICMNLIIHVYFILYIYINTQKCYNNNNNKTLIPKFLSWLWIFDILTRMSHMYSFSPFYFIWNHTFYSFLINMPFFTTFIYIYIYIDCNEIPSLFLLGTTTGWEKIEYHRNRNHMWYCDTICDRTPLISLTFFKYKSNSWDLTYTCSTSSYSKFIHKPTQFGILKKSFYLLLVKSMILSSHFGANYSQKK